LKLTLFIRGLTFLLVANLALPAEFNTQDPHLRTTAKNESFESQAVVSALVIGTSGLLSRHQTAVTLRRFLGFAAIGFLGHPSD